MGKSGPKSNHRFQPHVVPCPTHSAHLARAGTFSRTRPTTEPPRAPPRSGTQFLIRQKPDGRLKSALKRRFQPPVPVYHRQERGEAEDCDDNTGVHVRQRLQCEVMLRTSSDQIMSRIKNTHPNREPVMTVSKRRGSRHLRTVCAWALVVNSLVSPSSFPQPPHGIISAPKGYSTAWWGWPLTVEVEAKAKKLAVARLQRWMGHTR
jgi:hypothetical protein